MILPSFLRNSMLGLNSELSIDIPKRNVILTILPSQERNFRMVTSITAVILQYSNKKKASSMDKAH